MKRNPRFKILIALTVLTLLVSCSFVFADNHHITRGDFFEAFGICYGLKGSDEANVPFPDYDNSKPIINEMINQGWLVGRDTGMLDLDDEFTVADVYYFFGNFPWPKESVKEVYVGVPYEVTVEVPHEVIVEVPHEVIVEVPHEVTVEVPYEVIVEVPYEVEIPVPYEVLVPEPTPAATDPHEHLFFLNASGAYECTYCAYTNPPGADIIQSSIAPAKPAEHTDPGTIITGAAVYFDSISFSLYDGESDYRIPCNAYLYIDANGDGTADDSEEVGYVDFFKYISDNYEDGELITGTSYYLDTDGFADAVMIPGASL